MTTEEERLRILNMVQEGTITAEDAARLLSALDKASGKQSDASSHGGRTPLKDRTFRVRVTDTMTGNAKVNVNIPIGLVDTVLRFIPEDAKGHVRVVKDAIDAQMSGRIVDVTDDEGGHRVEIYVE